MRLVLGLSGVLLAVFAASAASAVTPAQSGVQLGTPAVDHAVAAPQSGQQYNVTYRLRGGAYGPGEKGTSLSTVVSDGRQAGLYDLSQTPFVTGVVPVTDPRTKQVVDQPYIVVLEEGTRVKVIVSGQASSGVTVDLTVEQSKITEVREKEVAPGTVIQLPGMETYEKRVFDFVNFGDTLVIPLGDKGSKGTAARLEIVVRPVEKPHPDQSAPATNRVPILSVTQCTAKKPPAASRPNEKPMMMVTPRVIIEEEEEEKMGVEVP